MKLSQKWADQAAKEAVEFEKEFFSDPRNANVQITVQGHRRIQTTSNTNNTTKVDEKLIGHRTISGIEFPVVDQLLRHKYNGKVHWQILRGLCNGIPDSGKKYKRLKDAVQDF